MSVLSKFRKDLWGQSAVKVDKSTPILELNRVAMRYGTGREILHDINLSLNPGAFYFVTGESGAGKSSLLKLFYLAHPPSKGSMRLFGSNVTSLNRDQLAALRRKIGVVFQDFRLLDHLTVFENVALPLRLQGAFNSASLSNVKELLKWVGLSDYASVKPAVLSGGQKQSAAIARAVIARPRLLLADEPTGNLDDRLADRLMSLFEELNRHGATVIIASHNDQLINKMGHPVIRLEAGAIYGANYQNQSKSLLGEGLPPRVPRSYR